jgi:hypothetical protein
MPPAGFETTISAGERPQTYTLDRAATGTGHLNLKQELILIKGSPISVKGSPISVSFYFSVCHPGVL